MKISTIQHDVETNLNSGTRFSIDNSAHLFRLLSDKLYADKPRAVLRELMANALDANPDGQFWVSLPSRLEPMLSIRDFGPGLSREFMETSYTRVGFSTKTDDDGQVGGFGIGRLAALSYCDAYTVVSIQNGIKSTYAVYKNEEGVPEVVLADEQPTDETNGLEVRVPIREADQTTFRNTTQDLLRWFPAGSYKAFGVEVEPETFEDKGAFIILNTAPWHYLVKMGPIAYQIDWSIVGVEQPLPKTIVPVFGIGDLELAPSRETLSYDKRTIAKLQAWFTATATTIASTLADELRALDPIPRLKRMQQLTNSGMLPVFDAWHKAEGHRKEDADGLKNDPKYKAKWGRFVEDELESLVVPFRTRVRSKVYKRGHGWRLDDHDHITESYRITDPNVLDTSTFIVHDLLDKHAPRIKDRLATIHVQDRVVMFEAPSVEAVEAYLPVSVTLLSELEPPDKERKKLSADAVVFYCQEGRYGEWTRTYDPPTSGLWVPFFASSVETCPIPNVGWRELIDGWAGGEIVYGLSKRAQKELLDDDWTRLDVHFQNQVQAHLADPKMLASINAQRLWETMKDDRTAAFAWRYPLIPEIDALKLDYDYEPRRARQLMNLAERGIIKLPEVKDPYKIGKSLARAKKKTGMLEHFLGLLNASRYLNVEDANNKALIQHILKGKL